MSDYTFGIVKLFLRELTFVCVCGRIIEAWCPIRLFWNFLCWSDKTTQRQTEL